MSGIDCNSNKDSAENVFKVSFFHDARFKRTQQRRHFTTGSLTAQLLKKRYLSISDRLTVVARIEQASNEEVETLALSSHPNVKFNGVSSIRPLSLLFGRDRKLIAQTVAESDFVIIRLPSLIGLVAHYHARRLNKPFLVELVGCVFDSMWNYGHSIHKLASIPLFAATRWAVQHSGHVIYVTQHFLQGRYPTRGVSIGCSDVVLAPIPTQVQQKRITRIGTNERATIGTIGNVEVRYKGQEYVLYAVRDLINLGVNIEYQMVGGGDQSRLKKLADDLGIADNVKFLGILDHDSIFDWLDSIDIYAQLSFTEGLPRSLLEAMSRGCACIGTNTGGIVELLDSADLVPKKQSHEFRERVMTLLQDSDLRRQVAIRNIAKAELYVEPKLQSRRSEFIKTALAEYGLQPRSK